MRCQCEALEEETKKWALRDVDLYRKGRPFKTTRELVRMLKNLGVDGQTLLDIGGGIGVIQLELLRNGATSATSVEASEAFVHMAKQIATEDGLSHRISHMHGDYVSTADRVPSSDIVTLDRVVCCYDDVEKLVSLSAAKAQNLYALAYPRNTRSVAVAFFIENLWHRIRGSLFRVFLHPTAVVDGLVRKAGLVEIGHKNTFIWQIVVYRRHAKSSPSPEY